MTRRGAIGLTAVAVTVMLALGVGPAVGKIVDGGHYSGTDSFSFDDCGFTIEVASEFEGHFNLRATKGGQAFLVNDNYSFRDVLTNTETNEWFVIRGNAQFHEIKATHVSGNLYEFVAIEAGQPFVLEDSDGNVVVRDRGVIRRSAIFDTFGDGVPGAELVEETGTSVHGPHPGFAEDFPFCEIAAELTGA